MQEVIDTLIEDKEQYEVAYSMSLDEQNILLIRESGLFDVEHYRMANPDVAEGEEIIHYYYNGFKERRTPSFLFSPEYYLSSNPDVLDSGMKPLCHYVLFGETERRNPSLIVKLATYWNRFKSSHTMVDYLISTLMRKVN